MNLNLPPAAQFLRDTAVSLVSDLSLNDDPVARDAALEAFVTANGLAAIGLDANELLSRVMLDHMLLAIEAGHGFPEVPSDEEVRACSARLKWEGLAVFVRYQQSFGYGPPEDRPHAID